MSEIVENEEQNPVTVAQFASFLILAALMSEIAEGNGVIDVKRLLLRLHETADADFQREYPGSMRLVNAIVQDMEHRLGK